MEVVDAEGLKKEKRTKVWKYDKFVEELKRIVEGREEVGLKIHMSEILEHLIDNRNVKKQTIRAFVETAAKRAGFKLEACHIKNDVVLVLLKRMR